MTDPSRMTDWEEMRRINIEQVWDSLGPERGGYLCRTCKTYLGQTMPTAKHDLQACLEALASRVKELEDTLERHNL